jgi:NADH-quinone oxidoreductase subunit E
MLPEQVKSQILSAIDNHEQPRGAALEALMIAVEHFRWVSDETLVELAELLSMTPIELDARATFYNHIYRKPVGRHVIQICDSVACWIMGSDDIREYLVDKLGIKEGQTTSDGLFTLIPIQCLGACDKAPAMMIDETLYTDLTPQSIDEILESYREK